MKDFRFGTKDYGRTGQAPRADLFDSSEFRAARIRACFSAGAQGLGFQGVGIQGLGVSRVGEVLGSSIKQISESMTGINLEIIIIAEQHVFEVYKIRLIYLFNIEYNFLSQQSSNIYISLYCSCNFFSYEIEALMIIS